VSAMPARRVSVVGTSGSGKTTTARRIAERFDIPHVELDALHWGPGWTPAPRQVFRARVAGEVQGDTWVVDGNYSKVRDIVWNRAEMVVWLDYALPVILGRLVRRTVRRSVKQEELWNGNRESLRVSLFSRESVVLWALRTYWRHRKEYSALLERPEYAHLTMVRLTSPRSARSWLTDLPAPRMHSSRRSRN
jgi:adenylate kinase family enzyme